MVRLKFLLNALCSILASVATLRINPGGSNHRLNPRTLPGTPLPNTDLVLLRWDTVSIITPSVIASRAFIDFYTNTLVRVVNDWMPGQLEADVLWITEGSFELLFVADTLGKSIPWNVVRQFCQRMIYLTNQGYLGTYNQGYWNLAGTFGVYAGLRINGKLCCEFGRLEG